jgi:hypothetical protein
MRIYQIYFEDSQRAGLEYVPYRNDDCGVYFESGVIAKLVGEGAHLACDYFGVVSHQLRSKVAYTRDAWKHRGVIANVSTRTFSPADFEQEVTRRAPDAMSFLTHVPHDPVTHADGFHPGFSELFRGIMKAIGHDWTPTAFRHVFYFNYFVARPEIYERYVREMLAPAMAAMDQMPELMRNSGYPHPLPDALRARFGVPHYPYHPFLCERFFSYFAHLHNLDCEGY